MCSNPLASHHLASPSQVKSPTHQTKWQTPVGLSKQTPQAVSLTSTGHLSMPIHRMVAMVNTFIQYIYMAQRQRMVHWYVILIPYAYEVLVILIENPLRCVPDQLWMEFQWTSYHLAIFKHLSKKRFVRRNHRCLGSRAQICSHAQGGSLGFRSHFV